MKCEICGQETSFWEEVYSEEKGRMIKVCGDCEIWAEEGILDIVTGMGEEEFFEEEDW
ncbi:MAG: hypothetical protein PHP64_08425 [Actinomycetota bacterium]|nr:hypothetical protein [Actinomycetota bacterium]